ncbi:MAG: hypothetical protein IKD79_00485, partial [Oscillospiraceae bacterium]|nr:hypothetical protein [Oscillospiraceae bacterium]
QRLAAGELQRHGDGSDLLSAGQTALQEAVGAALNLTFKAVDLKAAGLSPDGFEIGRWYRFLSPPHGIDERYQLTRISRDLTDPDKSDFVFGVQRKTISAAVAGK